MKYLILLIVLVSGCTSDTLHNLVVTSTAIAVGVCHRDPVSAIDILGDLKWP